MAEGTQVTVVGATLSSRMLKKIEDLVPVSESNSCTNTNKQANKQTYISSDNVLCKHAELEVELQ